MSDLREADTWLENNPICDADDLNKRERELVQAAWQAALSANGGEAVAFGSGDYTIEVGGYVDNHAVFIAPANPTGKMGDLAPPTTGEDKHRLVPGERVMTFPTEAQAFAVAEAIAGRRINRLDGSHPAPPSVAEPVAWVVFADNGNIRIWGREKPEAFPDAAPLYLSPTVKKSLTVQSDPIGYADPDSLNDYRAGDRLHIPVYRPDASADWQDGIPVYLHPAPPSVAVPDELTELLDRISPPMRGQAIKGDPTELFHTGHDVYLAQRIKAWLTAAPSPDHSGDAGKVEPGDRSPDYYEGYKDGWNNGVDAPSVPENEIKAQALEWFADWLKRQSFAHKKRWTSAANEALRCAARLRTAGDEGEESQ